MSDEICDKMYSLLVCIICDRPNAYNTGTNTSIVSDEIVDNMLCFVLFLICQVHIMHSNINTHFLKDYVNFCEILFWK